MADKGYVINLKSSDETPQKIVDKINSLPYSIEPKSIKGDFLPRSEFDEYTKKTGKVIEATESRAAFNSTVHGRGRGADLRWHGGGSNTGGGTGAVASVSNSDGSLTISPITGAIVASLNPAHANTWTGQQTFTNAAETLIANLETILFADQYTGSDIGAQINTAYAALPSTGGTIMIPSGTYSYSTPIVFGTDGKFCSLRGVSPAATFLKYTPTSGNAITMNCGNPIGHIVYEITGFTLMGKSSLIAAGQTNTNTSVGIYYGGANGAVGINTHDLSVNGFGSNCEIASNAYMLQFNNVASSGGNGGQASRGSLVHINAASNSGERNVFNGCSFTDPGNSDATNAIYITQAATASNSFTATSFDSAQVFVAGSNGTTLFAGCHFENPGAPTSYAEYIPILGVSSDSSTQLTIIGCEFANSASNQTWTTIIRHGGQLFASGNHIDNYNGKTVTNFILHDLDNGVASDYVIQTSVQGGALTNIIGGSGGVTYSLPSAACAMFNVSNSYSIGLRAKSNNVNEFFSGNSTTGTYDHNGNWVFSANVKTATLNISAIPTSSSGLVAGDVWNNSGVLNIV